MFRKLKCFVSIFLGVCFICSVAYINIEELNADTVVVGTELPVSNNSGYFLRDDTTWSTVATGSGSGDGNFTTIVRITNPSDFLQLNGIGTVASTFVVDTESGSSWNSGTSMLRIWGTGAGSALKLYFDNTDGGTRLYLWDRTQTLPNIPHTGIKPTLGVWGDILVGDIVAILANPMQYFTRASLNLPASAVTNLYSSRNLTGANSGAHIQMYPWGTAAGDAYSGLLKIMAHGQTTGIDANEVHLGTAINSDTEGVRLKVKSTSIEALVPINVTSNLTGWTSMSSRAIIDYYAPYTWTRFYSVGTSTGDLGTIKMILGNSDGTDSIISAALQPDGSSIFSAPKAWTTPMYNNMNTWRTLAGSYAVQLDESVGQLIFHIKLSDGTLRKALLVWTTI